jgi:hypothetical protein
MNSEEKLDNLLGTVKQMLSENCLKIEIEPYHASIRETIRQEYYAKNKDGNLTGEIQYILLHPAFKEIEKIMRKHKFTVTVDNLTRYLSQYPGDMQVVFETWESCITDAGTDLGGNTEKELQSIVDVNDKVVITI